MAYEEEEYGNTRKKKTYLDLFLENHSNPKKRGIYFAEEQELAIVKYNEEGTSAREKNELFKKLIVPGFKKIISGVLEMKMFRNLGRLNREEVIDNTFFRLIEKMHKFQPGKIGKSGQPVKAYSYFSTVAKHYILEQKLRNEKVLRNKADVESSIDLSILSEDTLEKMSNYDKQEVEFEDYITAFSSTRATVLNVVFDMIHEEESKDRPDDDFIKLGYCLKYLIEKWDKIEFMKKNEFMRILTLYTGLPQQKVSFLFKRFKTEGSKKIKIPSVNKGNKNKEKVEEELENLLQEDIEEVAIPEEYIISSMEEFESLHEKFNNKKVRKEWALKIKKSSEESLPTNPS
jgi:hypothetical protein